MSRQIGRRSGIPSGRSGSIRYTAVGTGRPVLVEQIHLIILLVVTGLVLIALETTALSRIKIPLFGWQAAAPSLGLLFSMAGGCLHGEREGGITGLFCGWLSDATTGEVVMRDRAVVSRAIRTSPVTTSRMIRWICSTSTGLPVPTAV